MLSALFFLKIALDFWELYWFIKVLGLLSFSYTKKCNWDFGGNSMDPADHVGKYGHFNHFNSSNP